MGARQGVDELFVQWEGFVLVLFLPNEIVWWYPIWDRSFFCWPPVLRAKHFVCNGLVRRMNSSIGVAIAEGQPRNKIMETFGITSGVFRSCSESLVWMTHLRPPVPGGDLDLSIKRLADMLGFTQGQYGYFIHGSEAFDEQLCGMLSPDHFVAVLNQRRLPITGRNVVCFSTKALNGDVTPVWAYYALITQCLGGVRCPNNPAFLEQLQQFNMQSTKSKKAQAALGKAPTARHKGVETVDPITCGTCSLTFTSIPKLRRHTTVHSHQLPLLFARKDKWLGRLTGSAVFKVCYFYITPFPPLTCTNTGLHPARTC